MTEVQRAALSPTLRRIVCLLFLLGVCPAAPCPAALGADTARELLVWAETLTPGMPANDAEALLGVPAETHSIGGDASLIRSSWLSGEYGIELYFLKGTVYRAEFSRRFTRNIDLLRTMDELTRHGRKKYGSMPRFDTSRNEYYWIVQGRRLAFSQSEPGELRVRQSRE